MNLSLRQLRAVLEIARLKSFTRAAEQLHMTQQGLSLLVREVEGQLGARLFDRTTRAVVLTDAGRQLLPVAQQTVRSLDEVQSAITGLSDAARRTLTVATTPMVASSLLPHAWAQFAETHPEVTVRVLDAERSQIQQLVESGEADVGFGAFFKAAAGLQRQSILGCELACFCPRTGPWRQARAAGAALAWRQLAGLQLLALPAENDVQQLADAQLAKFTRANAVRPTFRSIQTILAMVESGLGCAVLPSFAIAAAVRYDVQVLRLKSPVVPVNFYQVNLKGRQPAPAQAPFVAALLRTMQLRCAFRD